VHPVVVGYYALGVYAGWRFLSSFKPAARIVQVIAKVVVMINGFFMPEWAMTVFEKAMITGVKLSLSISVGMFIAPFELGRCIYKIIKLRGSPDDLVAVTS
jgi:hypothetical protein